MASSYQVSRLVGRVSCGICMEQYDYNVHVPKLLPCEHTFCSACLSSHNLSTVTVDEVECPTCKTKHAVPSCGFITNRTVLDIVNELEKDIATPASTSQCTEHPGSECLLVCMDCVCGLCPKCLKQAKHQGHTLEEVAEAKTMLKDMFEKQIIGEKATLDMRLNDISYSVVELGKAESNITDICDEAVKLITSWKRDQLSNLGSFKQQAVIMKNELQTERGHLQSLLEQRNIDIGTMSARLASVKPQKKHVLETESSGTDEYDFGEQTHSLMGCLQSVFQNQRLVTSTLLKKHPLEVKSKVNVNKVASKMSPANTMQNPVRSYASHSTPANTRPIGVQPGGSASVSTAAHAQIGAQSRKDLRNCSIKKVVCNGVVGLIAHINDDVVYYMFKHSKCKLCSKDRAKPIVHWMANLENVQSCPSYREHIKKMKEFYLSL